MNKRNAMLQTLRTVLAGYAQNHRAKVSLTEDQRADTTRKAETNEALVKQIDAVLAEPELDDYHVAMVERLQKSGRDIIESLTPLKAATIHMAMGVGGEAGELIDAVKRWAIYGKDIDRENVVEELGDLEFFMQGIRQNCDITRDETLLANMAKLDVRYKDGYSDAAAIARADKEPDAGATEGLA